MAHAYKAFHSMAINASAETCYKTLNDFDSYPQWFPFIRSIKILERGVRGRPIIIEYVFDVVLKQGFSVQLQYGYDDNETILTFSAVDGTFTDVEGYYAFTDRGNGMADSEFHVKMALPFELPERIIDYLVENASKNILFMLKMETERRVCTPVNG